MTVRVAVLGAAGRMGRTVCSAIGEAEDLELVAEVDQDGLAIDSIREAGAQVAVDFTVAASAMDNARWCAVNGVHAVIGTSGLGEADVAELDRLFGGGEANAVLAANFAIGAVLMMHFAAIAAPHFASAEIVEMHHDTKVDAPSGTAIRTAEMMAAASPEWATDPTVDTSVVPGARGGAGAGGIPIHALRVRGAVAHQAVVLGTTGQTLTIRHDTTDRTAFMPGVLLAVRQVATRPGLTVGLEPLLGL
ncbi:MAG TPA: 4-hydroxy-tetrahydrodipicolinate reductase [Acidimicrobiales bacterium]|nr:4-hydroxy-tetrahydrodipicolinate reductase [Acidimicrobiales bacterium]